MELSISHINQCLRANLKKKMTLEELDIELNEAEKIFILVNQWMLRGLPSLGELLDSSLDPDDLKELFGPTIWDSKGVSDQEKVGLYLEIDEKSIKTVQEVFDQSNVAVKEFFEALLKNIAENRKLPIATVYEEA